MQARNGAIKPKYDIMVGEITLHRESHQTTGFLPPPANNATPEVTYSPTLVVRLKQEAMSAIREARARGIVPGEKVVMSKDWMTYGTAIPLDRQGIVERFNYPQAGSYSANEVVRVRWNETVITNISPSLLFSLERVNTIGDD